jgi:hypothetical protein
MPFASTCAQRGLLAELVYGRWVGQVAGEGYPQLMLVEWDTWLSRLR